MKWSDLPRNPTPRMLRQFSAGWLVVFCAFALRVAVFRGHTTAGWILGAVAAVGIIGLFRPATVRWLFLGASVVAFPIGWVMTNLILAVMFFLLLTPLAVVFRLWGRDLLQLRRQPGKESFWIPRGDPPEPGRYLKQF